MKMDQFEDWVAKNREAFDDIEKPNLESVWETMPLAKRKNRNGLWIIIALLSLVVVGLLVSNLKLSNEVNSSMEQYVSLFPEHQSQRDELVRFVSEKEALVSAAKLKQEDYQEIFKELEDLESIQAELQIDFEKFGEKEKMMEMLFKYYERKARVLEILLKEIDKKENNEKSNHNILY